MRAGLIAFGAVVALAVAGGMALRADARPQAAPPANRPLVTAVFPSSAPDSTLAFARIRGTGASVVRLVVSWSDVTKSRPQTTAAARDPGFAGYDWAKTDVEVRRAAAAGLRALVTIYDPPSWAADLPPKVSAGPWNVDGAALANFVQAAATRYSGRYRSLPRVRYWLLWNEPNLARYLNPQYLRGKPYAPVVYRGLLSRFADAVHGVRRDNLVVAGATAPFTAWTKNSKVRWGMGPLTFMRTLLCLSARNKPVCSARAKFDVWSHHPYTSGGPTHHAFRAEDVSLGDLPEMRAVLDAAIRSRHIVSRSRPEFWITEFSWDTNPPDAGGVPLALHARWTAEALYRMWSSGVSLVTWWGLRDEPYPAQPFQSGLYFRGPTMRLDRPKPAFEAFRFPFVAYSRGGSVDVWGRTPSSRAARVRIEQRVGGTWRLLGVVRANRFGIFAATLARSGGGDIRAHVGTHTDLSNRFSLKRPKDRFLYPFGDWHP